MQQQAFATNWDFWKIWKIWKILIRFIYVQPSISLISLVFLSIWWYNNEMKNLTDGLSGQLYRQVTAIRVPSAHIWNILSLMLYNWRKSSFALIWLISMVWTDLNGALKRTAFFKSKARYNIPLSSRCGGKWIRPVIFPFPAFIYWFPSYRPSKAENRYIWNT